MKYWKKTMKYLVIFCNFLKLIQIIYGTKWMLNNPDFDDPANWFNNYLPCAQEEVVFPEQYLGLLPLPNNVEIKGFILPRNGALLLNQDASIIFNGDTHKRSCQKNKAYIRAPKVNEWFNPNTWHSSQKELNNKAIPSIEKVPCNNESVIIQNKGPLAVDLGHVTYLRMGQLSFAGSLLSKDYLRHLLNTDLGEIMFRNQDGIIIEYYHSDICGCHRNSNHFLKPICRSMIKSCVNPRCDVSIKPLGNCCPICGSTLSFPVNNCDGKRLHTMQTIIEDKLEEFNLQKDLDFHVNYFNIEDNEFYLQAVLVDREEYSGKSVNFVKYLNKSINWLQILKLHPQTLYTVQFSGEPSNPKFILTSFILIMFCVMLVLFVGLIIFARFHPNHRYLLYMPQWLYNPRSLLSYNWQRLLPSSTLAFARFENSRFSMRTRNEILEVSRPVVMTYDVENDRLEKRSFDNPLFNEQPSSSSKITEQISTNNAVLEPVVRFHNEVDDDLEEQDLTTINMNILS